jgi:hypothetical protein
MKTYKPEGELSYTEIKNQINIIPGSRKYKSQLYDLIKHRVAYPLPGVLQALLDKGINCEMLVGKYTGRPYIRINDHQNLKVFSKTRTLRLFDHTGDNRVLDIINIEFDKAIDLIIENLDEV